MKKLIIGYGIVGKNTAKIVGDHDWVDENGSSCELCENYDIAFIAVPTQLIDIGCNISIVEEMINKYSADIYCIRSTIPPKTTEYFSKKYKKNIVFWPEFYGDTIHSKSINDFLIFGGDKKYTSKVIECIKPNIHSDMIINQTDTKTAELVKYMENSWLATKVTFCGEFYKIANELDVDYNELRDLWLLDGRVNRSHTLIYEDQPYYDSHCLNKDIPALIKAMEDLNYNSTFLKSIVDENKKQKL